MIERKKVMDRRQFLAVCGAGVLSLVAACAPALTAPPYASVEPAIETSGGWQKYPGNPVLGGDLGVCFDVALLKESDKYRMWFSWRPKQSIALVESPDGIHWGSPTIVLGPNLDSHWEDDINRPVVLKKEDGYHLWYTGQVEGKSCIGYAISKDGVAWQRKSNSPVLSPEKGWEGQAVMCPHVIYDGGEQLFRMWYSAGGNYEPNAIGYATSADGIQWQKYAKNPIFQPDPTNDWEKDRVTACQVVPFQGQFYMFYIGFRNVNNAQIGVARSQDGISAWQRHPANPLIHQGGSGEWDKEAAYKPFAILDGERWLLWYNGRNGLIEQIGLAIHQGADLGF